jgi:hypothetical protein
MSSIFTLENIDEFSDKLNIDELYEKKKQHDLIKLDLFNKMLNNVHKRIKLVSRQRINNQICWYLVPETILGVPKYDQAACIAFLMDKLKTNGFNVRYIHPNLLFISWMHWVPSYVRSEIKKKTGINVNEYGQVIETNEENGDPKSITNEPSNPNDYLLKKNDDSQKDKQKKEYTPIKSYKPSGNLLYNDDILNRIGDKLG